MMAPSDRALQRRRQIVEKAVEIADRDGIEAVSMRRLAHELGLGTMTLYSYVASKDELLDLMLDEVSRDMLVPEPLPDSWREALRAISLRTHDAIDRHPWTLDARARRPRQRINTMRHAEQSLAALDSLDVDRELAGKILTALDDYTIGHAVRKRIRQKMVRAFRAAVARRGRAAGAAPHDPAVAAAFEAGELPRLADAFATRGGPRAGVPPEPDFEQGLEWMLDGIEALVAEPVA